MSLPLTVSRLTPTLRRSYGAFATTVHSGVFAWTRTRGDRCLSHVAAAAGTTPVAAATTAPSGWSETLSFASPESDFTSALQNTLFAPGHERPLPRTWREALHVQDEAVVITTARPPHRVVHVNAAWESLCGYEKMEALHKPIGPLLQQEQHKSHTNQAARHLLQQLQTDHYAVEHDAYLENFTKSGRPFLNHLRIGPLYMEEAIQGQEPDFLIGVLEEVQREDVPLRLVV